MSNNDTAYLNRKSVAAVLDCSVRLVDYMVARGDLPLPIKIGNLSRWRRAGVTAAIEALVAQQSKDAQREHN